MLRLHHPDTLHSGDQLILAPESGHHLVQVMRAKVGDSFIIFNRSGEFDACIESINKKQVIAIIGQERACNAEPDIHITLLQAVTRRERMDYSIQKATELGVSCIQPVLTEHCVVKLNEKKSRQRLVHWQGIARHASEQSGRLSIPEIKPVLGIQQALNTVPQDDSLKLLFTLAASQPLAGIDNDAKNIYLALGPVGGFSQQEIDWATEKGFNGIKLGPRILRAETATVAALTAIQLLWGDLNN